MSSFTNRPPVSFRSASTDCWNAGGSGGDLLLDSSDAILNDLNSIIDSHKKYMKYQNSELSNSTAKKSATHLVKLQSHFIDNNPENPSRKQFDQSIASKEFKSKSYLHTIGRQSSNTASLINQSFDSKSSQKSSLNKKTSTSILNCSQPPHATISGSITSKASKTKSSQNTQLTHISGSATTSFMSATTPKKKRSSLFNLFSFNKTAANSTSNLSSRAG